MVYNKGYILGLLEFGALNDGWMSAGKVQIRPVDAYADSFNKKYPKLCKIDEDRSGEYFLLTLSRLSLSIPHGQ